MMGDNMSLAIFRDVVFGAAMKIQHFGIEIDLQEHAEISQCLLPVIDEIFVTQGQISRVSMALLAIMYGQATRPVARRGIDIPICKRVAVLEFDCRTHGSAGIANDMQDSCLWKAGEYGG